MLAMKESILGMLVGAGVVWVPSEPQTEVAGFRDGVDVLTHMEGH